MGKRDADIDLNQDNFHAVLEDEQDESSTFRKADDAVVKNRVIKKPRSRAAAAKPSSTGGAFGSVFGAVDTSSAPAIGFGALATPGKDLATVSGFSFGATSFGTPASTDHGTTSTPAFGGFGTTFSFGAAAASQDASTPFQFGTSKEKKEEEATKSAFSFSTPAKTEESPIKTFNFATPQTSAFGSTNGLTFSFGKPEEKKESPIKEVTFGGSSTLKSDSEMATSPPKTEAPKFSFNVPSGDKHIISFGGMPVSDKKESTQLSANFHEKKEQSTAAEFTFKDNKSPVISTALSAQNEPSEEDKGLIRAYGKAVRSLNVSILSALQDQLKSDSLVNLIPLFDEYGRLWKDLETKHASAISLLNKSNDMDVSKSPQGTQKVDIPSSFSFATQNAPPKFGLNQASKASDDKPAFSFSAPKEFSFGSPAAPKESTAVATGFNVPSKESAPSVTGFTFVATSTSKNTPDTTGFSFSAPKVASKDSQPSAPSGFSFENKAQSPKFSFAVPATGAFTIGAAETSQGVSFKPEETAAAGSKDEEEGGEDEANITAGGVNEDLMKGSELENEIIVHEVRSKLNVLDKPQPGWNTVGLGMVRILKHKETGKVRLLCRSEGAGRVLLNIAIFPQMAITTLSPTMVQFAAVEDGRITKYLAKVKTANEATELVKAIEKVKAEL